MPKGLISSLVLTCERVLIEQDQVLSVIRIVDVFFVQPEIPVDEQVVLINLFISTKFSPGSEADHTFQALLLRPSGELTLIGEPRTARIDSSRYPDFPGGFNAITQFPVAARELGTHYIIAQVDGCCFFERGITHTENCRQRSGRQCS